MRHVRLTCIHHPDLRWSCKSIAVNKNGQYNGARNIFFLGTVAKANADLAAIDNWAKNGKPGDRLVITEENARECLCSPADLRFAPEELELQKTEPLDA